MTRLLKERDVGEQAQRLHAFGWSAFGGLGIGVPLGLLVAARLDWSPFIIVPVTVLVLVSGIGWVVIRLAHAAGTSASAMFFTGADTVRARREYSLAESYVARGMLPAAEAEYVRAAESNPDDPEPAVRLARLLRDRLQRQSEAAAWFRRALTVPSLSNATEWAILREYVELQERVLRQPAAALPVLTRAREQYEGTSLGDWAAAEISRIRETGSSANA